MNENSTTTLLTTSKGYKWDPSVLLPGDQGNQQRYHSSNRMLCRFQQLLRLGVLFHFHKLSNLSQPSTRHGHHPCSLDAPKSQTKKTPLFGKTRDSKCKPQWIHRLLVEFVTASTRASRRCTVQEPRIVDCMFFSDSESNTPAKQDIPYGFR